MNKIILSTIIALAAGIQPMLAVQAKKGVERTFTQADGTTVSVTVVGDERSHCYLTADGIPLLEDGNGNLCYATLDQGGKAVVSTFIARDAMLRSGAENAFLRTLDKDLACKAILSARAENSVRLNRAEFNARRLTGARKANQSTGYGLYDKIFPTEGTVHSLVIIVEYPDSKFRVSDPHDYFTRMLNEEGFSDYGATGSARDYFVENSNNQFRPTFDVYGPVELPESVTYYGGNDVFGEDKAPEMMVKHACEILDDEVDFSLYDTDRDGKVDNIFVIYAGRGEASGGSTETVWPHQWDLTQAGIRLKLDNVTIDHYACTNEWEDGRPDGIGTFVHEFSHVMGLPDLYTTDYGSASDQTPGEWSVLDYGPYNNEGRTPPAYSIFERNALGWIEPIVLDGEANITLHHILDSNEGAIKLTDSPSEFFLFENRQQKGWDKYLPGHGMLVWHIDYKGSRWANSTVNNDKNHQYVDIEEANGKANNDSKSAMAGYPFPGTSKNTAFTDDTTPNMLTWNKTRLNTPITEITEKDGVITFEVCGGKYDLDAPIVTLASVTPAGFTIAWETVARATQYEAFVYDSPTLENAVKSISTSNTSCKFDGLNHETEYYVVVYAVRGNSRSAASQVLPVTTAAFDFTFASPEMAEPEEVSSYSFVATWAPMEEAVDYLLTVTVEGAPAETVTTGFGSGSSLTYPSGWTTNMAASDKYTSKEYSGQAVPSLKFTRSNTYIDTEAFAQPVTAVSFWVRLALGSNDTTSDSYLTVYGRENESAEWQIVKICNNLTAQKGGEIITIDNVPADIHQLRFEYTKISGNLAFDDVAITLGEMSYEVLGQYDHVSVGNCTSFIVYTSTKVNDARSEYPEDFIEKCGYTIQAVDAQGRKSLESERTEVVLVPPTQEIEDVATDIAPVRYFNLQGIEIAAPTAPGIYIRRQGSQITKMTVE